MSQTNGSSIGDYRDYFTEDAPARLLPERDDLDRLAEIVTRGKRDRTAMHRIADRYKLDVDVETCMSTIVSTTKRDLLRTIRAES